MNLPTAVKKHSEHIISAAEPASVADLPIVSSASVELNTLTSKGIIISKIYVAAEQIIPCIILNKKNNPLRTLIFPKKANICKCTDKPPKPMKKAMKARGYLPLIIPQPVVISIMAAEISVIVLSGDIVPITSMAAEQIITIPHIFKHAEVASFTDDTMISDGFFV